MGKKWWLLALSLLYGGEHDADGNAGKNLVVHTDIDGILSGLFELKPLHGDDDISRHEIRVIGEGNVDIRFERRAQDVVAVGINEAD